MYLQTHADYLKANRLVLQPRGGAARARRRRALQGLGADPDPSNPIFDPAVEQWRSLIAQYAGGIPVNFLLAWVQRESAGNPCSYTSLRESGIFQLMPGQNMQQGGTTEGELRAACSGSSQQATRQLTDDELKRQVVSGIQYIQWARQMAHTLLSQAGVTWDESSPSFWAVVKLVFNYPGYIPQWLANATQQLGHPPADWNEFTSTINGYQSVLSNAAWVGSYGSGGGGIVDQFSNMSPTTKALIVGGITVAAVLLWNRKKRR